MAHGPTPDVAPAEGVARGAAGASVGAPEHAQDRPGARRTDAVRNREALVRAAEQVFAEQGTDVPLSAVVARAGVGRGTLYRHFPDRTALAAAVYGLRLAEFEDLARRRADDPDAAVVVLGEIVRRQPTARGLTPLLAAAPAGRRELEELSARTRALLAEPLRTSQAAGRVRPDVTVEDLLLVISMVEGIIAVVPDGEVDAAVARCRDLVLEGLRPR